MTRRLGIILLLLLPVARSGEGEVKLLTDESIPRYLARGQALARSGEWAKMIDIMQRIIVGDSEIFPELDAATLNSAVHTEDGELYQPARELCVRSLSRMPPEGLTVYRATYDPPAEELWKAAQAASSLEERLEKLTQVFDVYLVSSWGDNALEAAANLHLQLGHYFESLALLRRLIDVYPGDSDCDLAMARAQAAYCAARIGDSVTRDDMLERLVAVFPGRRLLVEGERVAVEDLTDHAVMRVVGAVDLGGTDDWPMAGGHPTRNRLGEDLPDDLTQVPFWIHGLQERDSRLWVVKGKWGPRVYERSRAVAPAEPDDVLSLSHYPTVRPVVHGDTLFFKDYAELVRRRLGSGELGFMARESSPPNKYLDEPNARVVPVELARPGTGGDGNVPTDASMLEAAYRWRDYGGNSVVVTSEFVVNTANSSRPAHLLQPDQKPAPNQLFAWDRATGMLRWYWSPYGWPAGIDSDPEARAAWRADFSTHQNAHFRGPGVVSGGMLYTIVDDRDGSNDRPGGVAIWGIRLRDGQVLSRTQLHNPDELPSELPVSASLAVAGSSVYALTNGGVLCAVDALPPGRIRWIRRYPRSFGARSRGARGRLHMLFAHNEPVIAGGKVVILPADSEQLIALDAETGARAWQLGPKDLLDVRHIVGVRGNTLVLAGNSVTGVDLQTGKVLWSHEHLGAGELGRTGAVPYGRGFLSEKTAYIPATGWHERTKGGLSYIHRFDIETGKRIEPHYTFRVPRLGNILCIGGRLIACNEDEVMCFTTPEREFKRIDERLSEGRGLPSIHLMERATIRMKQDPTSIDSALEDLRQAWAASERDRDSSYFEVAWRRIMLLMRKAEEGKDAAVLEEARQVARDLRARSGLAEDAPRPYEAQIALAETRIAAANAEPEAAIDRLQAFVEQYGTESVVVEDEILRVPLAARKVREQWMQNERFRALFEQVVRRRIEAAAQGRDKAALAAISEQFGQQPPAQEAWFALARIHLEEGQPGEAQEALRRVLRDFAARDVQAEAHLRLALLLAEGKLPAEARAERDEAVALLEAEGRKKFAPLLAELATKIPEESAGRERPQLKLPLVTHPFEPAAATPIPVEGDAPEGMEGVVLLSEGANLAAVDATGKVLWRVPNAAGTAIECGESSVAATLGVSSAVANARFARWVDRDLVVADVAGVLRIDPRTGDAVWRRPERRVDAAASAKAAVESLAQSLATLAREGHLNRTSSLPVHVVHADAIIRIHPTEGVVAYSLETGAEIWADREAKGALPGPPSMVGQLLAIGRVDPGAIDIFDLGAGRRVKRLDAPAKYVLAAPRLDRLGRLAVIAGDSLDGLGAHMHVVGCREGEPLLERPVEVYSRYAAVLHTDEVLIVLHDGSSGGQNLHFLQLEAGRHARVATEDISREIETIRQGSSLFVLTYKAGLRDEGARLFRVDLSGRSVVRYARPTARLAYARPVLTKHYVAIAGSDGSRASVQLFEAGTTKDRSPPAEQFAILGGRKMTDEVEFAAPDGAPPRFDLPPAVAAPGSGLVLGHPFGIFRLRAGDAR